MINFKFFRLKLKILIIDFAISNLQKAVKNNVMYRSKREYADLVSLKENLKIDIKALLCSSKEGLTERELKFEYKNFNGVNIPYIQLGYNTLYDLMRDMPSTCKIHKHYTGAWVFFPVHDEKTQALGSLVQGQNDNNKKKRDKYRLGEAYKMYTNTHNRLSSDHHYRPRSILFGTLHVFLI